MHSFAHDSTIYEWPASSCLSLEPNSSYRKTIIYHKPKSRYNNAQCHGFEEPGVSIKNNTEFLLIDFGVKFRSYGFHNSSIIV